MPEKIDLKVSLKYSIHMFPCLLKFARLGLFWHILVLTCFGRGKRARFNVLAGRLMKAMAVLRRLMYQVAGQICC